MATALQVAANVLQILLAACVVVAMVRSKATKRFRWFFIYVCYQVGEALLRWVLFWKGTPSAYYYWYWRTELFDIVLSFIALGESWLNIFRALFGLVWFRVLVGVLGSALLGYSWWTVWTHPRQDNDWLLATILQLDLTFTYVPVIASFIYFWLIRFFGIAEHRRETGVILGFMVGSLFSLAAVGLRTVVGLHARILRVSAGEFAAWVPVIGYLLCQAIWLFTFARRPPRTAELRPQLTTGQINERLGEYLQVLSYITGKTGRK